MTTPDLKQFQVRLQFADRQVAQELAYSLDGGPPRAPYGCVARLNDPADGVPELTLAVEANDLWSAVLLAMAQVHQQGVPPTAVLAAPQPEWADRQG